MNCRDCRLPLSVEQTLKGDDADIRVQPCACGSRWLTETRIVRRLTGTYIRGTNGTNGVHGPPIQGTNPPSSGGGVGGGLPELGVVTTSINHDPNSNGVVLSNPDQTRARNKRRADYEPEFIVVWEETGRRGVKSLAHRAWVKVGRPPWDALATVWRAYLLSERPMAGFVKDLSSWLNQRCHEQEWQPAHTRGNAKWEQSRETSLDWLERKESVG